MKEATSTTHHNTTVETGKRSSDTNSSVHILHQIIMGDRKARLAALAAKAGRTKLKKADENETNVANDESTNGSQEKKTISFRNYAPRDSSMDKSSNTDDCQDDGGESSLKKRRLEETSTNTTSLAEALAEAQNDIAKGPGASEETVTDMAPKKLNWDLKRDIESKLAKLERRTQRAIVELLKERLSKEAEEADGEASSDLD